MKFPIIHFSHGNGFPAKAYSKMLRSLQTGGYQVGYLNRIGHNPQYPVTDGWPHLVDELIDSVSSKYQGEKVIALGHSLGGFLSFMAAVKRPDLFTSVVMLDSPIMGPVRSEAFRLLKKFNLDGLVTPRAPKHRAWNDLDEVRRHFHMKLKDRLDGDVLEDFVVHATETCPVEGTRKLSLCPDISNRIFKTVPHHFPSFEGKLKVPSGFIGGRNSKELRLMGGTRYMERTYNVKVASVNGTHIFPLEYPVETAEAVKGIIQDIQAEQQAVAAPSEERSPQENWSATEGLIRPY